MSEIKTGTMYTLNLHDMLLHGQDFGMALWGEDFSKMHIDPYWQWVKTGTEQEEVNAYLMVISQAKEIARLRAELKEIEEARMLTTEVPDSWIEDEDEDEVDYLKMITNMLTDMTTAIRTENPVIMAMTGPQPDGEYKALYITLVKHLVIPLQQWAMDLGDKRVIPDWMWAV